MKQKTPAEIHATVGLPITSQHADKMFKDGWRAYKESDITNIIEEAKAEQSFHNDTDESDADVIAAISDMVMDFKPDVESDNSGTILDRVKAAVEYEPVLDAKAESKGVCEWKEIWGGFHFCQKTGCGHLYKNEFIDPRRFGKTFCPGCGKEIKVV